MHRTVRAAVILSLILLVSTTPLASAADTQNCLESSTVNRFAAWGRNSANVAGADATIENQALNYCSSSSDNDRGNQIWAAVDRGGLEPRVPRSTRLCAPQPSGAS